MGNLADYYSVAYDEILEEVYTPVYHKNGFDFKATPILAAEKPNELLMYNWGLIPWFSKSFEDGVNSEYKLSTAGQKKCLKQILSGILQRMESVV